MHSGGISRREQPANIRTLSSALALAMVASAYAADVPDSYAAAQRVWEKHKDTAEYQTYVSEFVQFNNHFHIDERSGCYALGQGSIGLMLVITHPAGSESGRVANVFSDASSPKARCFMKAYLRLRTKVPPFVPFVLQMTMG